MRLAHGVEAVPVKSVPLVLEPRMSVEDAFAAIVQACLAQFQANLPGVLASGDIEYVHQARVALRRLRAALRLYRKACVLPDDLMGGLRTLAAALGPSRDWDVLCTETLPAIAPSYPEPAAWQRDLGALFVARYRGRDMNYNFVSSLGLPIPIWSALRDDTYDPECPGTGHVLQYASMTYYRADCWCGRPLPLNGGLAITKVSQQKGFRHLHPAPCIVLHATQVITFIRERSASPVFCTAVPVPPAPRE